MTNFFILFTHMSEYSFTILVCIISFLIKVGTLASMLTRAPKKHKPLIFLSMMLISDIFDDITWVLWSGKRSLFPLLDTRVILFSQRIAWVFYLVLFVSLGLLIEHLFDKNSRVPWYHRIFISGCAVLAAPFIYIMACYSTTMVRPNLEFTLMSSAIPYCLTYGLLFLGFSLYRIRSIQLPVILQRQLYIFLLAFIGPYIGVSALQYWFTSFVPDHVINIPIFAAFYKIVLSITIFFGVRRVFGMRFLDTERSVESVKKFNFIDDFKFVLSQLGQVCTSSELVHITQTFFQKAFFIRTTDTAVIIRNLKDSIEKKEQPGPLSHIEALVENFIRSCKDRSDLMGFLVDSQILIYDEIEFSYFYDEDEKKSVILAFMREINADIFLPVFYKQTIIGYIIVARNARKKELYTSMDRDEMTIYADYLGNIVYLLQHKNFDILLERESGLRQEVYNKHQEINAYKESIRSFVRNAKERKIGILFYKRGRFTFGNQSGQDLITINPNTQDGHPIAKALKQLVKQVEEFRTAQNIIFKDMQQKNRMVFSAIPVLEQNNIVIIVTHPEVADVLKEQAEHLDNPSDWDYLLYLETTKLGQMVDQLIPSNGPKLLQFKIELLKIALSKKPVLLEMAEEDGLALAQTLHHIMMRQKFHTLKLLTPTKHAEIAVKLFGLNPLFGAQEPKALFEQLDDNGTLFIQNVQFLDMETQVQLAHFIKNGFYFWYKSDNRLESSVRLIFSTTQNLELLVQEGKFSEILYEELLKARLAMPSLLTLPEEEFIELAQGYANQTVQTDEYKSLLDLNYNDKAKLLDNRPATFEEFKLRIRSIIVHKSRKNDIYSEALFDSSYTITDPELAQASRLGRRALRDAKIMQLLWSKFKNQSRIATFLGVNRSSVNKRCKDFGLQ
jgi:DNA-binding NtrC family response regulator